MLSSIPANSQVSPRIPCIPVNPGESPREHAQICGFGRIYGTFEHARSGERGAGSGERGAGSGERGEQGVWQGQPGTRSMKFIMPSSRPRSMIAGSPDL
ncbi:hypothetical protein D2E76_02110 [Mycobacteroides abscessus]|uniref:Uncharacterized protein n=1 Tax=Mycobacteroides abscessus TaxID=36809 RepID=A0ABD7HV75_9MYCO|nr:hypothetical protein DDJ71_13350 [Mycobacteroides abscessus]RIR15737.1 hypothetical protein D2E27_09720 [Mycobacteroides abscessus]RIR44305.1 hypothetical protein D2E39_16705 [Mycobacteroides abscessus]RIR80947.1 hypothetical protein D2E65_03595 [Mycobacteroides abscessus]RIS57186.1 hypothetical protein D2E43_09400 [Mycobacteroides abscessus]